MTSSQDTRLEPEALLTTAEVAARFRVYEKTVTGWVKSGRLAAIRTPTGRYRYREADILALVNGRAS